MNIGELISVKTLSEQGEKHTPYSAEIRLFSCIQQGDVASLLQQIKGIDSLVVMGEMSDDELMQYKYMAVSTITLATRYAIQGGLNEAKAYAFSDRVIKAVDKLTDKNDIILLMGSEIVKLTHEVKKSKCKPEFSPHTKNSVMYINENLTRKITVADIAEHCGISADYLSQVFKKETGENLGTYIMRQKLEKAKEMLRQGIGTKEICASLGFSSQSYFVTAFKRFYNMTPTEYVKMLR
ncbi:MAG: helix-turn-helix transcriptional regulator [Clostridia bacterium]|nr:helix-turn-helix transcriptional regulator [Clostridia bacterium]